MVPTYGAALIIIFGTRNTLVGRLLSVPPLRWLGLISYSAYLWHQPFLVYLRLRPIALQVPCSSAMLGYSNEMLVNDGNIYSELFR